MNSTFYNPPKWTETCAPTTNIPNYRHEVIRCVVHDPTAWILGGVSGNAGVFSNHGDLIIFMKMMLNKGAYMAADGSMQQLIKPETIELFTTAPHDLPYNNTRALGWDTIPPGYPNVCGQKFTPGFSFGHTGYTGTTLWADSKRGFALISLTNRVWPYDTAAMGWYRNNLANMIIDRIDQNATATSFNTPSFQENPTFM